MPMHHFSGVRADALQIMHEHVAGGLVYGGVSFSAETCADFRLNFSNVMSKKPPG